MLIVCPDCGFSRDVSAGRLAGGNVRITCPKCGCKFRLDKDGKAQILDSPGEANAEEDIHEVARRAYEQEQHRLDDGEGGVDPGDRPLPGVPWADAPGEYGWLSAFFRTASGIMTQAPQFAARLRGAASLGRPLIFFLIVCVIQMLVEHGWTRLALDFINSSPVDDPQLKEFFRLAASPDNLLYTMFMRAGLQVMQLYAISFLMYAVYSMLAPGRIRFSMAFQILAYGSAPMLLCIIPVLGFLAGLIWSIISVALCFRQVTGLDWPRVMAGFLPPFCLYLFAVGQIFNMIPH